jgi:hypothetical protein
MATNILNQSINDRWTCPKCEKAYSKNYSYKSHLKRCVVHTSDADTKCDLLGGMLSELKQELRNDIKHELVSMLNNIRQDITRDIQNIHIQHDNSHDAQYNKAENNHQPLNKRKSINPF